jgi:hypothetical protein
MPLPLTRPCRDDWGKSLGIEREETIMNHYNAGRRARAMAGAVLATLITAFFAAGIATGVVTPQLAPVDPVAVVWDLAPPPAPGQPGA